MSNSNRGFTDKAATSDDFNIGKYVNGLAEFIERCNTPMTIAIQGDWGSGKTSMMQMVWRKLPDSVLPVWFNTWQYSQFNMDKELTISFLSEIVGRLNITDESVNSNFHNVVSKVGRIVRTGVSMAIDSKMGGKTEEVFSSLLNALTGEGESQDAVKAIEDLRAQFENCVEKALSEKNKERLVIFVDDLDRLSPGRAVELLEVLKLFLDCDKCVFVLAIDYAVVTRGVKDKYGEDFSEDKGRSFFDKIIQVPFKMPVSHYDIKNYVSKCLESIGVNYDSYDELQEMVNLIQFSIGNNPRSMKRLFNSYLLLSNVIGKDILKTAKSQQIMFAILCMQSRFEPAYNYIVSHQDALNAEFLYSLSDQENEIFRQIKLPETDLLNFTAFANSLVNLVDQDHANGIDEQELKSFQTVLHYSTITSTGVEESSGNNSYDIRYAHEAKCRSIYPKLNDKYHVEFMDHFYRTKEHVSDWRINCENHKGRKAPDGSIIKAGIEFLMTPAKYTGKSTIQVKLYSVDGTLLDQFYTAFGDKPFDSIPKAKCERYDNGYIIRDLIIFNTFADDEKVYRRVDDAFACVARWFQ